MISMIKTYVRIILLTIASGSSINVNDSYDKLRNESEIVHATPHINNIIKNGIDELATIKIDELNKIGLNLENNSIIVITPPLDNTHDTEHFRFHFTTEGNNAVENLDYVIAMGLIFEQVWDFFMDSLGYTPSFSINDEFYHIYVENLPSMYFAYTVRDGNGPSCSSYIKMRNSYSASQFSENSEEDNIKVTAVHEFFHAIQFDYNCYALDHGLWFMEATAVWSEDELYDEINDLYRYMPNWFNNPNKSILDESFHMYGSFIFFQYIDEHLGGAQTIRSCWENSKLLSSPIKDVTLEAVDQALESYNSSFEDAYVRMRIANRILSNEIGAGTYAYDEAEGYSNAVGAWGSLTGPSEETINFVRNSTLSITKQDMDLYASAYYSLNFIDPIKVELNEIKGKFHLTSIFKHLEKKKWTIRSGKTMNFDPELGMEWVSLIVSSIDKNEVDWEFSLKISDGYSEDYTSSSPFPNPTYGDRIFLDLQVISSQTINTKIIDLLGREIWSTSNVFSIPSTVRLAWNGINNKGRRISNGVYYFFVEGAQKKFIHKFVYLKD